MVAETPVEQPAEVAAEETPETPAVEEDDRDPMGTWRILDNPGKMMLNFDFDCSSGVTTTDYLFPNVTIYREDGDQRGCRRIHYNEHWSR